MIASGSSQPSPHKDFDVQNSEERRERIENEVKRVKNANSVLILGSGVVGIETAGVVAEAFKGTGKRVGLLTRSKQLLSVFPEKAH